MVNYSARTDEIITLNENIIIINNLKKKQKKNQHWQYTQTAHKK